MLIEEAGIKKTSDSTFFVIFVNDEANSNFWPTYIDIWNIHPKLVQPNPNIDKV